MDCTIEHIWGGWCVELYCLHNWSGADTQFAAQNGQMLDNTQSRFHADLVCSRQLHATVDHLLLLLFVAATTTSIHPIDCPSVRLSVDQSIIIINVLHWCVIVLSIGVTKSLDASLGCWMRMLRRYSRSRCCYPCWISFMRLATLWLRGLCFRLTLVRYGSCSFYMCVSVCSMLL